MQGFELSENSYKLLLPEILDIEAVKKIYVEIRNNLPQKIIKLDGSKISIFSTSALQLLIALKNNQLSRNNELKIENPSEKFSAILKDLGFNELYFNGTT
jgi:anti-anti-sigma regulatory factor